MQIIFKYGGIQDKTLTPNKELNILIYRMPSYVIIYKSYAPSKNGPVFLVHPVYVLGSTILRSLHSMTWGQDVEGRGTGVKVTVSLSLECTFGLHCFVKGTIKWADRGITCSVGLANEMEGSFSAVRWGTVTLGELLTPIRLSPPNYFGGDMPHEWEGNGGK